MKFLFAPLLSALALAFFVSGCGKSAPAPNNEVLLQAVEANVHALEKKDVDAVMATIHPQAPSFESTREFVTELFQTLDLKYTISDLRVVSATPEEAHVAFTQKTEKRSGSADFPGNIVQGIHTLRPDGGKWKIYRTLQTNVTDLEGKPLGGPAAATPEPASAPAPAAESAPAPTNSAPAPAPSSPTPPAPEAPAEKPAQ